MKEEEENRRVRNGNKPDVNETIELTDIKKPADNVEDKGDYQTANRNLVGRLDELWQSGEEVHVMHDYITLNDKL